MSPEHVEMTALDARADISSVGIILYEASVGRQPFEGQNPHAVLKKIVEGDFTDPLTANPGIGHHLAEMIRRCLQKHPEDRYGDIETLLKDLDEMLEAMEIVSPKEALTDFLSAPSDWQEREMTRIVDRTMTLGLGARRIKRHSEAMDHFNRVLALEPGNERAIEAVAGMNRLRRLRAWLERAAIAATALIVVSGVAWALARDDAEPTTGERSYLSMCLAPTCRVGFSSPDVGDDPPCGPSAIGVCIRCRCDSVRSGRMADATWPTTPGLPSACSCCGGAARRTIRNCR